MTASARSRVRCAIYTRKSSEEGLEQSFNSLQAQREACEAYIASQRHEGWQVVAKKYDDGGFSGGNMNRPALKQLLEDIAARLVDTVVVYKVDRLTRSLIDFAKIIEAFDQKGVSFVFGDPAVQYDQLDGAVDLKRAVVVCPVRAGSNGRADTGQDSGLEEEGHVDGRGGAARL